MQAWVSYISTSNLLAFVLPEATMLQRRGRGPALCFGIPTIVATVCCW